ncbi:MAG TPA: YihY/virulence factor BrkB family protein [Flavisolibacter sp.]|jgi:membrane protein|nr:YihY/virulence factor BrkB family protein [Flavisolibacter sp.]
MLKLLSFFATFFSLLKAAFRELSKNDPLRMAGATAFFTIFALPPILIIILQSLGLFFSEERIQGPLFRNLETIIGKQSVDQVVTVLQAFKNMAQNWPITIGGFIFLLFVATTLFKVVRSSLNQVWKIKVVQKKNILRGLGDRLQALAVILIAGILFIIGLMTEALQGILGQYLVEWTPRFAHYFNSGLNHIISILMVTAWFAILFRYLPDGKPTWAVSLTGAFLTSLLFTVGKVVIRWLLTYSNINTVYGTSGSVILLLLFVFYSSLILYYGAAFTKVWGLHHHEPIKPNHYAMHYKLAETDED